MFYKGGIFFLDFHRQINLGCCSVSGGGCAVCVRGKNYSTNGAFGALHPSMEDAPSNPTFIS